MLFSRTLKTLYKKIFVINIFIDYKNLLYFTTTKILNKQQTRWFEKLKKI